MRVDRSCQVASGKSTRVFHLTGDESCMRVVEIPLQVLNTASDKHIVSLILVNFKSTYTSLYSFHRLTEH